MSALGERDPAGPARLSRLAVIGPGLIGRSVALAARRAHPVLDVVEIDRGDPIERAEGADLVVLAAPVEAILEIVGRHAAILRPLVAVDTGSTKRAILLAAQRAGLTRFVAGHPMAGAERPGPEAARADLFDYRPWFLVPGAAEPEAVVLVRAFVEMLGARPLVLHDDGTEHDRAMAAVSHLPQVVASVLMALAADAAGPRLAWAGAGLRDTTRLAASSGDVWAGILATNADELRPLLLTLAEELARLAHRLDDAGAVRALFTRANHARAILEERARPMS